MAVYGIMRVEKRTTAACGGLQAEHERTEKDSNKHFDRSDIDWQRTAHNEHIIDCGGKRWTEIIAERAKADGFKVRHDKVQHTNPRKSRESVVVLDSLYTASAEWFRTHSNEEADKYFADCLQFHIDTYCQGDRSRVLSTTIHYDEETPHMHVDSIPLVSDGVKVRLSAKDIMGGPAQYRARQEQFFQQVTKSRGMERGELQKARPEERRKHLTVQEYKIAQNEKTLEQQERQAEAIKQDTRAAIDDRDAAHRERKQAWAQVQELERERGFLASVQVKEASKDVKPAAFSKDRVMVNRDDYNNLLQTAALVDKARANERRRQEKERKVQAREQAVEQREKYAAERETNVEQREEAVHAKEEQVQTALRTAEENRNLRQQVKDLQERADGNKRAANAWNRICTAFPQTMRKLARVLNLEDRWHDLGQWMCEFSIRQYTKMEDGLYYTPRQFADVYKQACKDAHVAGEKEILQEATPERSKQRNRQRGRDDGMEIGD